MQRTLQPEILDSLPADHPDALHNRRDRRLTNRLLGSHRWLERILPGLVRPGERVLELGAGTGELALRLGQRGLAVSGLDVWPRPSAWPAGSPWYQEDLRTFDGFDRYAVVFGNLIFHQFSAADLDALGQRIRAHARVIVACEPTRRRLSQVCYRTLGPAFGANHVSLHDAHVSIAAGFRGRELAQALGLVESEWTIRGEFTLLGLHHLVAIRRTA
jgi:SAM-dependent methyltransferase